MLRPGQTNLEEISLHVVTCKPALVGDVMDVVENRQAVFGWHQRSPDAC